ncbi:MAG: hypothetical protein EOO13_09870, partial [Chitinophagaceae bacterium]
MNLFIKKYLLYGFQLTLISLAGHGSYAQADYLQLQANGSFHYTLDAKGNSLPDFSLVGYAETRRSIPVVRVERVVSPSPDDEKTLQAAIDELSAKPIGGEGFRGAILLKKGTYKIAGTINIRRSGIVLRGEGIETKLIATGKGQRTLVSIAGAGALKEIKNTRQRITSSFVPLGAKSFLVANAAMYKPGDSIVVFRPGTQKWITDLKMDQIEKRDSNTKQWTPREYDLHFERVITKVAGNTIFIDNPVVMAMEEIYGGGEIYKYHYNGRITNTGIEDLLLESEFDGDKDEDHGWDAIKINRVQNGWVRNVTSIYFGYSCVNLGPESRNITVMNCKSLDAKS